MTRKIVIIAALMALAAVVLWTFSDQGRDARPVPQERKTSGSSEPRPMSQPRLGSAPTNEQSNVLWFAADVDDVSAIPGYSVEVEGAVKLKFDSTQLRALGVGDTASVYIPQTGMVYRIVVDEIKVHSGAIRTVAGHQSDDSPTAEVLLTLGENNTFAHVTTADGSYELVGNTEVGWLMDSANMDQHVDPTKPDYVIPEMALPELGRKRE